MVKMWWDDEELTRIVRECKQIAREVQARADQDRQDEARRLRERQDQERRHRYAAEQRRKQQQRVDAEGFLYEKAGPLGYMPKLNPAGMHERLTSGGMPVKPSGPFGTPPHRPDWWR